MPKRSPLWIFFGTVQLLSKFFCLQTVSLRFYLIRYSADLRRSRLVQILRWLEKRNQCGLTSEKHSWIHLRPSPAKANLKIHYGNQWYTKKYMCYKKREQKCFKKFQIISNCFWLRLWWPLVDQRCEIFIAPVVHRWPPQNVSWSQRWSPVGLRWEVRWQPVGLCGLSVRGYILVIFTQLGNVRKRRRAWSLKNEDRRGFVDINSYKFRNRKNSFEDIILKKIFKNLKVPNKSKRGLLGSLFYGNWNYEKMQNWILFDQRDTFALNDLQRH